MTSVVRVGAFVACCALATGCQREARMFDTPAPNSRPASALDRAAVFERYEENALALANGKRLFTWYNCNGCHAAGGGGSGPALMDDVWIYGSDPVTIYRTIADGRPNGMPAFGTRIPEDELWQLVAYVRSLSGFVSQQAAPNRDDAMHARKPESNLDKQTPVNVSPATR